MKKLFLSLSLCFSLFAVSWGQDFGVNKATHLNGSQALGISVISFGELEPDLPIVNFRFWFDDNTAIEAGFGFLSGYSREVLYLQGKLLTIIQNYNSLNLYALAFAGFGASNYGLSESKSLLNAGAGLGIEWFIIDNLSLSYEIDFLYSQKAGDNSQFGISADVLPRAGIKFYL